MLVCKEGERQHDSVGFRTLGPVGFKFNPGFFFLCSKEFSRVIFSVILGASNHHLVDKKN